MIVLNLVNGNSGVLSRQLGARGGGSGRRAAPPQAESSATADNTTSPFSSLTLSP